MRIVGSSEEPVEGGRWLEGICTDIVTYIAFRSVVYEILLAFRPRGLILINGEAKVWPMYA